MTSPTSSTLGFKWLAQARERWSDPTWATTRVYLGFLAHVPDTLIERKFGERIAARVREEARPIESSLTECPSPEAMTAPLIAFDRALKERGLNPGTSADLTVATLFAASLIALERPELRPGNRPSMRSIIDLPILPPPAYVHPA